MDYYKNQNKYFAVNGIGSITEITERVSSVLINCNSDNQYYKQQDL
jgi:adenylate kinase